MNAKWRKDGLLSISAVGKSDRTLTLPKKKKDPQAQNELKI